MSNSPNRYERTRVASQKDTPAEILMALAEDTDAAVRAGVICNESPNLPDSVSQKIAARELRATTSNWVLRQSIAASTRVLPDQHRAVASEREWYVCIELVNNVNCPLDLLVSFAKKPERGEVDLKEVRAIARNKLAAMSMSQADTKKEDVV